MTNKLLFEMLANKQNNTLTIRREFAADRALVWDCYTKSELLDQWFSPKPLTTRTKSMDFSEGGHWRFVFTGPDGKQYKNHLAFQKIERPHLFVVDHLNGPKYHGAVTFDDLGDQTRVTMYWTFENVDVFTKIRETVVAGNEGNFDRLSAVVAGQR